MLSKIRKNNIFPDKLDNANVLFYTKKGDYGTVNYIEVIHTLVTELKKEASEWCVWYGNQDWDNEEKIEKSKKELLEKINKVEELLKK